MNTTIPQCNPKASYLRRKVDIDRAVAEVLERGVYIHGDQVAAFEEEFASYQKKGSAVAVANGTDALELILRAFGIGAGMPVFTVSHTAVATVAAVERAGARPVLVDIDRATFTMCPKSLERAVAATERAQSSEYSGAVIVVHLYGQPCPDIEDILTIAKAHRLAVIEDCSQAHGAEWRGRKVGTLGEAAAFSLYPTKNLGALGDGGIALAREQVVAEKLRLLREYGWAERYISRMPGCNSRLDEIQAAILRVKLKGLDEDNELRRNLASTYSGAISNPDVQLPTEAANTRHVYHQFVVRCVRRDSLQQSLTNSGIGTLIHYPVPIHQQPAYGKRVEIDPEGLPCTELCAKEILSLPMHPDVGLESAMRVAEVVNNWRA
jgi:dTDP-4-amino-4,6-dideoxygalactose transaminase